MIFPKLPYKQTTAYVPLPGKFKHSFVIEDDIEVMNIRKSLNTTLDPSMYTILSYGYNGIFVPTIIKDGNVDIPNRGFAYVRFAHTLLYAPNLSLRIVSGPILGTDVSHGNVTCYQQVHAGVYNLQLSHTLRVLDMTQEINIMKFSQISFDAGRVYTFYVHGSVLDVAIYGDKTLDIADPVSCNGQQASVCNI